MRPQKCDQKMRSENAFRKCDHKNAITKSDHKMRSQKARVTKCIYKMYLAEKCNHKYCNYFVILSLYYIIRGNNVLSY